jgi:hypothetical protein
MFIKASVNFINLGFILSAGIYVKTRFLRPARLKDKLVVYSRETDWDGSHPVLFAASPRKALVELLESTGGPNVAQESDKDMPHVSVPSDPNKYVWTAWGTLKGDPARIQHASQDIDVVEMFRPFVSISPIKPDVVQRNLMLVMADYFSVEPGDAIKEPLPTYEQCTPKEFYGIFCELHEGLVDPEDDITALITAADMMHISQGSPFQSDLATMCGVANNGHPRREELLELYNTMVGCFCDGELALAEEVRSTITEKLRIGYAIRSYEKRKVTNSSFILPRDIAEDICRNLEALQYIEFSEDGDCLILRPKTDDEHLEDHYHERDNAVIVEAPPKQTRVEIPAEMAKKAGINGRVNVYSLKNRIEIYAAK